MVKKKGEAKGTLRMQLPLERAGMSKRGTTRFSQG
jgi:hypothetical protein